ncbi:hypothetical protein D3C85_927980 [compost metagenome]
MHGHQQLRGGTLLPGFDAEGAGNRVADPVAVADVQAKTGTFHGRAIDVQGEQGGRQVDAFLVDLVQTGAFDALAAHHAVHVRNQQVDIQNFGVFLKECVRFTELNGTQGYRHVGRPIVKNNMHCLSRAQSIRKAKGSQARQNGLFNDQQEIFAAISSTP